MNFKVILSTITMIMITLFNLVVDARLFGFFVYHLVE